MNSPSEAAKIKAIPLSLAILVTATAEAGIFVTVDPSVIVGKIKPILQVFDTSGGF